MEISVRALDGAEKSRRAIKCVLANADRETINGYAPLIHEVLTASAAGMRQGTHSTINKSEFRGGSRKPWRQKGTGRARAGGSDSPIWVGGAVAHGPKPRSYAKRVPSRSKGLALEAGLADRASHGRVIGLEGDIVSITKTKDAARIFDAIGKVGEGIELISGRVLLLVSSADGEQGFARAARNLPYIQVRDYKSFGVGEVLSSDFVLLSPGAIGGLEARLSKWLTN